jgi:Zn-dependent peptidase ImmA (M78 family)
MTHSQVATTNLNQKITYVRTAFINSSDDRLVRRILLHEAGHIFCHCTFEAAAEQFANEHE